MFILKRNICITPPIESQESLIFFINKRIYKEKKQNMRIIYTKLPSEEKQIDVFKINKQSWDFSWFSAIKGF